MTAFEYPDQPHVRRHGPQGYRDLQSYRPWLRNEFLFRCVYCLKREQWGLGRGLWHLDHFVPQASIEAGPLNYDNLLYVCATCNAAKGVLAIPDPLVELTTADVRVQIDGRIEATTAGAKRLIRLLGLDDPEFVEFRAMWIGIAALAKVHDPALYEQLMGFPTALPDLSKLRPPQGNSRPSGVQESVFAKMQRGELGAIY